MSNSYRKPVDMVSSPSAEQYKSIVERLIKEKQLSSDIRAAKDFPKIKAKALKLIDKAARSGETHRYFGKWNKPFFTKWNNHIAKMLRDDLADMGFEVELQYDGDEYSNRQCLRIRWHEEIK